MDGNGLNKISSTTFQRDIGGVLHRVSTQHESFLIMAHGRPRAVMVPIGVYLALAHAMEMRRIDADTIIGMTNVIIGVDGKEEPE